MVKNDTSGGNVTQEIHGRKRFGQMVVLGDLYVEDGLLNDCFLDKAVLLHSDQRVMKKLTFETVLIERTQFEVKGRSSPIEMHELF